MTDPLARLAWLVLLLLALGGFLVVELRARPGQTARQMLAWVLIFVAVIAGVGLWGDVRDTVAPRQRLDAEGRIEVPVDASGHAQLTAEVNGARIRFMVDTGASDIALSRGDARRAGIDPDALAYTGTALTANGRIATAPVRLRTVALGGVTDRGVPAVVIDGDLGRSLLGMSYLRRFARVSFEGGRLLLER